MVLVNVGEGGFCFGNTAVVAAAYFPIFLSQSVV
jgi:hypothetical protein